MTKTTTPNDSTSNGGSTSETTSADSSNNHNETNWKDFAVSLLTSPDPVMRIMDEQRLERLAQCRALQQALRECREENQLNQPGVKKESSPAAAASTSNSWFSFWNKRTTASSKAAEAQSPPSPRAQLEDFPMGIRMMRYFLWRDIPDDPSGRRPPCLREEHALWACRGVSLQCGPDLIRLRDCFGEQGPEQILSQGKTAYETTKENAAGKEDDSDNNKFHCLDFQTKLGSCISQNAKALEERVQRRRQQQKQQAEIKPNKKES